MNDTFQHIQHLTTSLTIKVAVLLLAICVGIVFAKKSYKMCASLSNNLRKSISVLSFITSIVYFTETRFSSLPILMPAGIILIAVAMILDTWELKKEDKSK